MSVGSGFRIGGGIGTGSGAVFAAAAEGNGTETVGIVCGDRPRGDERETATVRMTVAPGQRFGPKASTS